MRAFKLLEREFIVLLLSIALVHHPNLWAQCLVAEVLPDDGAAGDLFGWSATMNTTGTFVGAFLADNLEQNSGAVYILDATGILQEMVPPFGRGFGQTVSVHERRLLVGGTLGEYAFILEPNESDMWTIIAQMRSDDWQSSDIFGSSVGLSGDTVVVGAYNDSNENGGEAGSAYVFERDPNGLWVQTQKLLASDGQSGAEFGYSVAIDGDVIVVGAWTHRTGGYQWAGKAYVFERDPNSGLFVETARLRPPVSHTLQNFGVAVAIDGLTVLVGAVNDYAVESLAGAAYFFQPGGDGSWNLVQQITAEDFENSQFFGGAVALRGGVAVIGVEGDDTMAIVAGAAYLFIRDSDGVWRQHAKFTASDGAYYDRFGYSVALDGSWAVIGAPYDDDNGTDSGSAYIFRVGPDWSGNGVPDICECPGDIDYSGAVGLSDLSALLTNFGLAAGQLYESGDIDGDYDVDLADLSALLERYGVECP